MSTEREVNLTDKSSGRTTTVKFFEDDTVEVVRAKVGMALGIHQDRLRMYVNAVLPGRYYVEDPRAWKALFVRMSPDGKPIQDVIKKAYNASRDVPLQFPDGPISEATWSTDLSGELETSFHELRLLGVPESSSWVFPLDNTTEVPVLPIPAEIARPSNRSLFKTVHSYEYDGITVVPWTDEGLPVLKDQYVPLLKPTTGMEVPESMQRQISEQDKLLTTLRPLAKQDSPTTNVLRVRWKVPWVETDFGEAVRNRFEQIFFGSTLTEKSPYVGLFTSRKEQTRHKFYTEETVNKKPTLDLKWWAHWWTVSKPTRNRPTLLFYRGDSRNSFDRVGVTATDMIISCQRPDDSTETVEEIQASVLTWIKTMDALMPFIVEQDLSRFELQTVGAQFNYEQTLDQADFLRFDCLRSIYDIADKKTLAFHFLRADGVDVRLSQQEVNVLQLLREEPGTSPEDVSDVLNVTIPEAEGLLTRLKGKLAEDPDLLDRVVQSLPLFRFSAKSAVVVSTTDLERTKDYITILRYILKHPNEESLDSVCPKRAEGLEVVAAIPEVQISADVAAAAEEDDILASLLDDIGGDTSLNVAAAAPPPEPVAAKPKKEKAKVKTTSEEESLYNYFNNRLQEFDPETFSQSTKKCDLARQPVVMSEAELATAGEFNPLEGDAYSSEQILETEDPTGVFLCPEYWCVVDKIPLREEDLVNGACPVCGGKIREPKSKQKVSEYSVMKRSEKYMFPGELKEKAANGKILPCCFQKPQKTRVSKMIALPPSRIEQYYVLDERKMKLDPLRFAYLQPKTLQSLELDASYDAVKKDQNRIQAGRSGLFRVGMGRPKETLPNLLGLAAPQRPSANPKDVLRCSFFRTWKHGDGSLESMIATIDDAYTSGQLSVLNELEYVCIALDCDLYRLMVAPDGSVVVGCMFESGFLRATQRAIAVLFQEEDPETIDYLGFVSRTTASSDPQIVVNVFNPVFGPSLQSTLDSYRRRACWTSPLPTMKHVLSAIGKSRIQPIIILDPYRRAQALFVGTQYILPFQPETLLEVDNYPTIGGYAEIPEVQLPPKDVLLTYLQKVAAVHRGYEYKEDIVDTDGVVREIVTAGGFRIPVRPFQAEKSVNREVTKTVRKHRERTLVFGKQNEAAIAETTQINYESELFDFLLFQLSKDLEDPTFSGLKEALETKQGLAEALDAWFTSQVIFHELEKPTQFISKIRTPCSGRGEADCTGLCAWQGAACKVDVKNVAADKLKKRLLSTLLSNEKIRSVVLEHRMSPFFSTVLYLEMPHELFLSDTDLDELKNLARSE